MNLNLISTIIIPLLTAGVTIGLFLIKFHSDAKRNLDELLLDLEHKIYLSDNRNKVYIDSFPKIRKAYHELMRWLPFSYTKKGLKKSFIEFRGSNSNEKEIQKSKSLAPNHKDFLLTSRELCCLPPSPSELDEYMSRIAGLRRFTGSRK